MEHKHVDIIYLILIMFPILILLIVPVKPSVPVTIQEEEPEQDDESYSMIGITASGRPGIMLGDYLVLPFDGSAPDMGISF